MKSVMSNHFQQIPSAEIPRSSFDISRGYKTAFDGGLLVPVLVLEALPGDTINLNMTALARLATPIKPVMDNMWLESFFFAVPVRQVWDNWEKFNGEQVDPGDSTDYVVPTITSFPHTKNSLADYFGLPVDPIQCVPNALPFRCYNAIFNNWFRDQNLVQSVPVPTGDGPDVENNYKLLRRRKRPDYFTSCLPWPQKGSEVLLPLGDQAPIQGIGLIAGQTLPTVNQQVTETDLSTQTYAAAAISANIANMLAFEGHPNGSAPTIYADLSQATASTINELRQAFQIQRLLERDARGGTRYPEILRSHFGVQDPQMLVLQRPEFLGGGSTPINIKAVEQTAQTDTGTTPQGNLAAFGTAHVSKHGFTKSFTEHCYIIGIVNVRADLTYQQGMERLWLRSDRFDFYWPALSHLGEQEVTNSEIFHQNDPVQDIAVFGYQERYAEYRYGKSLITGAFRSTDPTSLDVWHLSQEFATLPTLGQTFIEDNPPIARVIAVDTEPHFLFDAYFNIRAARPMPVYSVPGMIDHF